MISLNLLKRDFTAADPDQKYVGDITYIWTAEGWLYLATVIDLYSRRIVGWSMDKNMKAKLVNDALLIALWERNPKRGLIWHTDRGSQYASISHREILKQHQVIQSMSRKGDCWDNSVAESFFHTLKTELTHHQFLKLGGRKNKLFSNILKYFIIVSAFILLMIIYHQWTLRGVKKLTKNLSGKVWTHHTT